MPGIDLLHEPIALLVLALLLGALIGIERQLRRHPAGLHTNALVALGSAAYMVAATGSAGDSPARVMAQITTGIGFLCGGVIMRQGATVRGLNTAATVWCSAAVGVLAGAGMTEIALVTAGVILLANILLHWLEHTVMSWPPGSEPQD
ncbi:MAG: MgtC/SapB family protein [Nevskiaceae bacterium]|nr:MAG: MgtC/SapB family protein [Nevskiaceae bacterium]